MLYVLAFARITWCFSMVSVAPGTSASRFSLKTFRLLERRVEGWRKGVPDLVRRIFEIAREVSLEHAGDMCYSLLQLQVEHLRHDGGLETRAVEVRDPNFEEAPEIRHSVFVEQVVLEAEPLTHRVLVSEVRGLSPRG